MFWLFMSLLWVVMIVAPVALVLALLPAGRDCPRCGVETFPIRVRALLPLRKYVGQRWCAACSWEGMMRVPARGTPVPALEPVLEAHDGDDADAWRGGKSAGL